MQPVRFIKEKFKKVMPDILPLPFAAVYLTVVVKDKVVEKSFTLFRFLGFYRQEIHPAMLKRFTISLQRAGLA